MRRVLETGQPVLIDLLTNRAGTFVVSRIPLRDDAGKVIRAIGIVLFDHPETTLQPLISKFALLQRDLDDARRELAAQRSQSQRGAGAGDRRTKYTLPASWAAARLPPKSSARRAGLRSRPARCCCWVRRVRARSCWPMPSMRRRSVPAAFVGVNIAAVPDTCWRPSSLVWPRAPIPAPTARARRQNSSWPTAARCFSTRSATCPPACRPSCCARCRRAKSNPGSNTLVPL